MEGFFLKIMKRILANTYIIFCLLIWIFPTYESVDVIGGQWLNLSILNTLGIMLVFFGYEKSLLKEVILSPILFTFILFLLWGLGSFFYAFNTSEVLIETFRNFTLFLNLILTTYFLKKYDLNLERFFIIVSLILFYEVVLVLFKTLQQNGTLFNLNRNQVSLGIAANINITSYSILYKIPFLFFLRKNSWRLILAAVLAFSAFYVVLMLGSRSAYLAIITFSILSVLFHITNRTNIRYSVFLFLLPALLAFSAFNLTSTDSMGLERVSTLTEISSDQSLSQRKSYYLLSLDYFKENPVFGMGLGNWKIESIPYIIDTKKSYIMPYHAHNDYLQVLAETGIIGFSLYLLIFIFLVIALFKIYKLKNGEYSTLIFSTILFLVIYFFDASFNFPYARPIIQIFLLFVIASILSISITKQKKEINNNVFYPIILIIILLQPISIYSNYRVLKSLQQQNPLLSDFNSRNFNRSDEFIESVETHYPSVGVTALPLKAMLANYYSAKDPEKAISLALSSSKDNPYTYLGEIIASRVYKSKSNLDSASYYAKLAFEKTPTIELSAVTYIPFITRDKDTKELERVGEIIKNSNSEFIWSVYFESLYQIKDTLSKYDQELLEMGAKKFPNFKNFQLLNLTKEVSLQDIEAADNLAIKADYFFTNKEYTKAIELYKQAQGLVPKEPAYAENIARSYMLNEDFDKALVYFKILVDDYNITNGFPEFYIGAILYKLEKNEEACQFLNQSLDKGYNPSKQLMLQICLQKEK